MEQNLLSKRTNYMQRILLFFCSFILCMLITLFIGVAINKLGSSALNPKIIRISIIIQNIVAFIMPSLITAVIISTNPIKFLQLGKAPKLSYILFLLAVFIFSAPAINWLGELNKSLTLPESMHSLEVWMRAAENEALAVTNVVLQNNSILSLIVSVMIIGILTGFSEEIFFRGTFQRILSTNGTNIHIAIWMGAILFSALHFQFYGFIPRLLLGAFLGYLLWWSKSLWIPIIGHAFNNSAVIISVYIYGSDNNELNSYGANLNEFPTIAITSAIITTLIIIFFLMWRKKHEQDTAV